MKLSRIFGLVLALLCAGSLVAQGADPNADLIQAAKAGHLEDAKKALENGANVNCAEKDSEVSPLICAAFSGNSDLVKLLLDKGADVKAKTAGGVTALMAAVVNANNVEIARLLIDKGAQVNAKSEAGVSPLKFAEFMVSSVEDAQKRIKEPGIVSKSGPETKPAENAMIELIKKHGGQ